MRIGSVFLIIFLVIVFGSVMFGQISTEGVYIGEQNEELTLENQFLKEQNQALSEEARKARSALQEIEAENRELKNENSALLTELSTASSIIEEAKRQAEAYQAELEVERIKNSTLIAENTELEGKWNASQENYSKVSVTLQEALALYQTLKEENAALQEALNTRFSLIHWLFPENSESSSLPVMSSSILSWASLSILLLSLGTAGGYQIFRKVRTAQVRASRRPKALAAVHQPLLEAGTANPEIITIQIPRRQLSRYVRWLRQNS